MTLALNYLIAFLLLVTIGYCWRLNKKIVAIHKSKKEMMALLKCFDNAIVRAGEGIQHLKHAGMNAGKTLQEDVDKAKFLVEDLNFMIERASKAADRLDENINISRHVRTPPVTARAPVKPHAKTSFKSPPPPKIDASFYAETETPAPPKNSSKRSSIEVLLEKLAGKEESYEKKTPKAHRIPLKTPQELGALPTQIPKKKMTEKEILYLLQNN